MEIAGIVGLSYLVFRTPTETERPRYPTWAEYRFVPAKPRLKKKIKSNPRGGET